MSTTTEPVSFSTASKGYVNPDVLVTTDWVAQHLNDPQVRILSAYKQGYLWLTEQVIPSLKGKGVKSVRIQVAKVQPDLSKKYKFYEVPTRWVHELYPVDDVFTRDLGVAGDDFHLELVDAPKDIYTLDALDAACKVVQHATFTPKTVER